MATDQMADLIDNVMMQADTLRLGWQKLARAAGPKANDYMGEIDRQCLKVRTVSFTERDAVQNLIDADDQPQAYRRREVAKQQADTKAGRERVRGDLAALQLMMKGELERAAMPREPRDPQAVANARDLLKMQVQALKPGDDPTDVLKGAVRAGGDVAAVAAGPYGRALLGANGADPDTAHTVVRHEALRVAAEAGDPAAVAWTKLPDLKKLCDAAVGSAQMISDQTDSLKNEAYASGQL